MVEKRFKKIAKQDAARRADKKLQSAMAASEQPSVSPLGKIMLFGGFVLLLAAVAGLALTL